MHGYCSFANNILLSFFFFSPSPHSLFFSLCFHSHLSLFLSLVPHSHLSNLRSKLATASRCRSKLTRWSPPKQAHLLISFGIFCLISGFWGFDLFNSLFDSFGIFCLISGFWGFDTFFILCLISGWWWLMMVADDVADDGAWWCWLMLMLDDGGWVGWRWVWIDRWWWLGLWWVYERVLERSMKMNILLNKCVE